MSADDSGNSKPKWIRSLANGGAVGEQGLIEEYALRLMRLIARRGGRAAVLTTESRFVTGLGRSHPVENGFAWHPTLGVPSLPGSSIKGLVRSWLREYAEPTLDVDRLLGSPGSVGGVCFLDAVPTGTVQLEADVMTPHYAGWSENDPPGDWCAPNPIPFLTTAPGIQFLFGVVPRRAVSNAELDALLGSLGDALTWAGGGAKTAVGYGRFRIDQGATEDWTRRPAIEDQRRRDEQARQETMATPEGRWRLVLDGLTEAEILGKVRIHLEKEPMEDPFERAAFARAVAATDLLEHWRRGETRDSHTGVGKKKLKKRAGLVDEALTALEPGGDK